MRNEIGFFMIYDTKYFIIFEIDDTINVQEVDDNDNNPTHKTLT